MDYHKLILDIQVRAGPRWGCTPVMPFAFCFMLSQSCVVQDFKDGNIDTAFIVKHEEELSTVRLCAQNSSLGQ